MKAELRFHGILVTLISDGSKASDACAEAMKQDFQFELVPTSETPEYFIEMRLHGAPADESLIPKKGPVFSMRTCSVHGSGASEASPRVNRFGERDLSILKVPAPRKYLLEIHTGDEKLMVEMAHFAILSLVGEALDLQGYHRVHALGFEVYGQRALCLYDEGAGKSTLAMALRSAHAGEGGLKFFSDETPLVRGDQVFAFPLRMALKPGAKEALKNLPQESRSLERKNFPTKLLYPWKPEEIATQGGPLSCIILDGGREHSEPRLKPVTRGQAILQLIKVLVVGVGVPQMAEYFVRFSFADFVRVVRIGLSRLASAVSLCVSAKAYRFYRSPNPEKNARFLMESLKSFAGPGDT
jgi:hypothetical protein